MIATSGFTLLLLSSCNLNWRDSTTGSTPGETSGDNTGNNVNNLQRLNAPEFNLAQGSYPAPDTLEISSSDSGVTIHYTTDGSTPTCNSAVYSSAFIVSTPTPTTMYKAIACKTGSDRS